MSSAACSILAIALGATLPTVTISDIEVRGAKFTRPELVTSTLRIESGREIRADSVQERVAALHRLGVYTSITATLAPDGETATRLLVSVTEPPVIVPPEGYARYLRPDVIVRNIPLELDLVRIYWTPEEAIGLFGLDRLAPIESRLFAYPFVDSAPAVRVALLERARFRPLIAAHLINALADQHRTGGISSGDLIRAIRRIDQRFYALRISTLTPLDAAWLSWYAARRYELLEEIDPAFRDRMLGWRDEFWGPAGIRVREISRLNPGDSGARAALYAMETLAAAYGRIIQVKDERRSILDRRTMTSFERGHLGSADTVFRALPPTLTNLPLMRRVHTLAAALTGNVSAVGRVLADTSPWQDPAEPGYLLVFAQTVENISAAFQVLAGIPEPDKYIYSAEKICRERVTAGAPLPPGPAGGVALVLSESPREVDWSFLVRGAPADALVRYSAARHLLKRGDFSAALPHLRAALAIGEDTHLHYLLAVAYLGLGDARAAEREFRTIRGR